MRSCLAANYPASRFGVLVIADNCSDRTSSLAAAAGARVVERFDPQKKSKGYAIEFLMESLARSGELDALDALVIIDADTTMDADLLRFFDQGLQKGRDWIQCYYTVANPDQSWRTRLMTYAFSLFNGVMLLGQNRLGASAGFKGNGMCFATRGLRRRPWRSYGLVEDMEYSWTLRMMGEKIAFEPEVAFTARCLDPAARPRRTSGDVGSSGAERSGKNISGRSYDPTRSAGGKKPYRRCELTLPPMEGASLVFSCAGPRRDRLFYTRALPCLLPSRGFLLASCTFMTASMGALCDFPVRGMRLPWRYAWSIALFPVYLIWKLLISLEAVGPGSGFAPHASHNGRAASSRGHGIAINVTWRTAPLTALPGLARRCRLPRRTCQWP